MESRHLLKNVNVSLRKVRTFLPVVKKMSPIEAIEKLSFMPHSAAKVLVQGIKTAISNAEATLKVPKSMLEFRSLKADQGMVLKRFRAGSRGTALPVNRRMSHITITLGIKGSSIVAKKDEMSEKKTTEVRKEEVADVKKEVKKVKSVKKVKTEKAKTEKASSEK